MPANRMLCAAALLTASMVLCGCAHSMEGRDRSLSPVGAGVVTSSDVEATGVRNALDAVRRLRPELLRQRNAAALSDPFRGYPVVYLNGVLQGGFETLETIPAAAIVEIRYVTSAVSADQFGVRHPGGVIAVSTRRP